MFGRKRKAEPAQTEESVVDLVESAEDDQAPVADVVDEPAVEEQVEFAAEETEDEDGETAPAELAEVDWRADGPFDYEEVELGHDEVTRIDLGSLIVTPWEGLGVQLQVDESSRVVQAITCIWEESGLEVVLFAAPSSGGLAHELQQDLAEEVEAAGGKATIEDGVFGPQVKRVLPQAGPKGEQLFHVSQVWFAEGPRWLLRGTLLGEAALADAGDPKAAPFVEFFRNLVVRRGDKPMVPGEVIGLKLPEGVQ
jgi:Protein of unknown function (DUF3710).